jgi:hypothetical protein
MWWVAASGKKYAQLHRPLQRPMEAQLKGIGDDKWGCSHGKERLGRLGKEYFIHAFKDFKGPVSYSIRVFLQNGRLPRKAPIASSDPKNPPTPLAAGGARQRRNYQQQGPRSHYKQQGQEARKQERGKNKKQFPQARSVPQGPAVWLWRRRRFGSDS